jgi:hypothetical protein
MGDPAFINVISCLSSNFLQHLPAALGCNSGDDTLLHLFQSVIKKNPWA